MDVASLIRLAAQKPSVVARRSGISRNTIGRLNEGENTPSLNTLQELAFAMGYMVDVRVTECSDPNAAIAARWLIEEAFEGVSASREVEKWVQRFSRFGIEGPEELIAEAGRLSTPRVHPDARFFTTNDDHLTGRTALIAASAAQNARQQHVVSGAPAAARMLENLVWGPVILWVAGDPGRIVSDLEQTLRRVDTYQPSGLIVAEAPSELMIDPLHDGLMTYASPIQTLIDLHGLEMGSVADQIASTWRQS